MTRRRAVDRSPNEAEYHTWVWHPERKQWFALTDAALERAIRYAERNQDSQPRVTH